MKKRLALALVATLAMGMFIGCTAQDEDTPEDTAGAYEDGTYEGVGEGYKGDIKVSVEVADGKITTIDVVEQQETEGLGDEAIKTVSERIIEAQSTEVEVVSGATSSSNGTMEAVKNALESK